MFRKCILIFAVIGAVSVAAAQNTITPRDADEAEAWRIYQEFRASRAAEAAANKALVQARVDIDTSSLSTIGMFGSDPEDRARLIELRRGLIAERKRQAELLQRWENKFFWRYGDLLWSEEPTKVKDRKTGREIDRIEFALIYFPFDPKNATPPIVSAPPPPTGSSFAAEKGTPDAWSHIKVTLNNVTQFTSVDQRGWRNNGTGFTAMTSGTGAVGIRIDVSAKAGVSYYDYDVAVTVKDGAGKVLYSKAEKLSKDGGSKWYSMTWDPGSGPGQLTVSASISGGNPESFTYFVSGGVTAR